MSQYTQTGIDAATTNALTPALVRGLSYAQTAALCGITLGDDQASPEDFFFIQERAAIAQALEPVAVPPSGGVA